MMIPRTKARCLSALSQVTFMLMSMLMGTGICQSDSDSASASAPSPVYGGGYGYTFFDDLRLRNPSDLVLSNDNTSSVYQVTVTATTSNSKPNAATTPDTVQDTTDTFRLVEIKTFLPLSSGGISIRPVATDEAFTALLAMQHWNQHQHQNQQLLSLSTPDEEERSDSDSDVDGPCNVRMTMELFDTQLSPIVATRTFTNLLQKESTSFQDPPVAAVVGAYRYVCVR
jgi:hypothetical protein